VARGSCKVRFGGNRGRTLALKAGDAAVLPAGTGHQNLGASEDFLVVGAAYPADGAYDECSSSEDHAGAIKTVPEVRKPRKDPVYGAKGPLTALWKTSNSRPGATMEAQVKFPLPVDTEPMEAKLADAIPSEDDVWQYEPKWDGFSCLSFKAGDAVDRLRGRAATQFVIDGEIVIALSGEYSFDALQMRLHPR
jgi:ATP-dependent DNA ligase